MHMTHEEWDMVQEEMVELIRAKLRDRPTLLAYLEDRDVLNWILR